MRDAGAIARVAASIDRLDVLINNAGANFAREPSEWDPATFADAVHLNLVAAFELSTALKPRLAASTLDGGASVVNVASMASFAAVVPVPGYGAAKAGIVQMTQTLAVAWAADGIRVNAVAPGLIRTNMTAAMQRVAGADRAMLERTPMRRWGDPEDVVETFLFLASSGARFVTGQTWCVDGGYTAA
jgi:NAD(P)-dependent dehydrogenase (short-subunit alcohol dehydrogenase family)